MPEPGKVDASSQPCATGMPQQPYKSLLFQQLQKLKKQPAVFQTQNEGSGHNPKFRTTVWVDGESYSSPNTFQKRKPAEMDACKVALLGVMLKLKNEALHCIREDRVFSKSILVEYSVRLNIQMPTYETQTVETGSPPFIFRSTVVFNAVSYTGDECKSKKEAEQSAARAVILIYLESETGNILSEIIKSKFSYLLTKETQIETKVVNEAKVDEGSKMDYMETLHTSTPQIQTVTETTPSIQMPTVLAHTLPLTTQLTQTVVPQVSTPVATVQTPVVTAPACACAQQVIQTHEPQVSTQPTPVVSAPASLGHFANISAICLLQQPITTTTTTSIPATEIPAPVVSMPTVMALTPITNNVASPVSASTSTTIRITNNVDEAMKTEPSTLPTLTGKKRSRKNKKNALKRIKSQNQVVMSAMFHGQLPTFSAQ